MCFVNDVIMKTSCFHNVLEKANRANANWVILIQKVLQVPEDDLGPKRNSNQLLYAGRLDFKHICVLWCQCIMGVFHISYFNVFHFFVPTGPYVYFGEKILKLFGRSYSRTSLSLRDAFPFQNGWIFGKVPKGGGVIFNPKIYIAKFGPLSRAIWPWNWYKGVFSGYVFQQLYW